MISEREKREARKIMCFDLCSPGILRILNVAELYRVELGKYIISKCASYLVLKQIPCYGVNPHGAAEGIIVAHLFIEFQ